MAANQLMEDLQRRASAQLGGGYPAQQQTQAPKYADAAKYTHSYDNTPVTKNGVQYNGTHSMTFEAPKTASAQWGSLSDMQNHFRDQQQRYDPAVRTQQPTNGNSLLQGVVNARNRAMNEVVYPTANIRNARALLGQMQDAQYKQGHLGELAAGRLQRQNQFVSELAQKQQDMNLRAQQFDRTHDLNMQNAMYARQGGRKPVTSSEMLNRGKVFDDSYVGQYGKDIGSWLGDNSEVMGQVRNYYMQNNAYPELEQYEADGWLGKNIKYRIPQKNSAKPTDKDMQIYNANQNDPEYQEYLNDQNRTR